VRAAKILTGEIKLTIAICFSCGEQKFGAFTRCGGCKSEPVSDDELVLSLSMTDHYFDHRTLEQMAQAVRRGDPPRIDPKSREMLLQKLSQFKQTQLGSRMISAKQKTRGSFSWPFRRKP
jgi:hypothetical protein